jgi:hypothetical protein
MKRSTEYAGLDVHQATTVASVREQSGHIIARTIVPTEEAALLEFVGMMRGSVHVAFEEGTQTVQEHQDLRSWGTPRFTHPSGAVFQIQGGASEA